MILILFLLKDKKARLSARRMDSRKPVETVLNDHRLAEVDLI